MVMLCWEIRATCFNTESCETIKGSGAETYSGVATTLEYGGGFSPAEVKAKSRDIGRGTETRGDDLCRWRVHDRTGDPAAALQPPVDEHVQLGHMCSTES